MCMFYSLRPILGENVIKLFLKYVKQKRKKYKVTYFSFTILVSLKLQCYKIIPNNLTSLGTLTFILIISVIMNHMIFLASLITYVFILMSHWPTCLFLCGYLLLSINSSWHLCLSFLTPSGASFLF